MSSSAGIGPDGKIYCKHMEEAAKRKANTAKHPNREVYCCKRSPGDPTKCNFWFWADQLLPKGSIAHASSSSARSPSKEGAGPSARPTSTPHTRPLQRHFSSSNSPSEIVTPQSRKRLEDIEVGLRERKRDLSPTRHPGPSEAPKPSTPLSIVPDIPQPPSPVPTEVDSDEVEVQPRKAYSFLGLHYSPESIVSAIKDEGQLEPSTPKKRRLSPQPAIDAVPSGGGLLLTPPQTTRRIAEFDQPQPLSAITRNRKGKVREGAPPVQTDQDGSNSEEPQAEDSLPLFTLPEDTSTASSVSPTNAENVLDYTDGMKARVKALSEYMDSFDITQAAKLLQTVERQKIQYEYRDRSQKLRIDELVAERDKLAAEVSRLKEALQRAEDRNGVKEDGGALRL